jgi:hypothetical protein
LTINGGNMMHFNKIIRPSVGADLSALSGFSNIRIILLVIIGPWWMFRYPDEKVKKHYCLHLVPDMTDTSDTSDTSDTNDTTDTNRHSLV